MIKTILTAVITYLATGIDEIPVLFMLYTKSNNQRKRGTITAAYFTGTFLLVAIGMLGAMGLLQIPAKWMVGFIGLLPIIMGIKILLKGDDDEDKAEDFAGRRKTLWAQVLTVTLALGADDLGVYIPLFTTVNGWEILQMLIVFAVGTAALCLISYKLTNIDKLACLIEKQERFIEGFIFIAIGIMVLAECGTLTGIINLFERMG